MATLINDARQTITNGTPERLTPYMVNAAMTTPHARRLTSKVARVKYATALTRNAIRGGLPVEGLRLVMSDSERAAWDADNPLPE